MTGPDHRTNNRMCFWGTGVREPARLRSLVSVRYCIRHTHRGTSRAWRMILAHHSLDRHAQQQVTDEHDGCADCWQDTAVAAVDAAGSLLISSGPLPEMDTSGVVTGPTVNWLLRVIDGCLRAEELDRREVDGSDR